jgi:outer membrane protein assembly factor BamD
MRLLLAVAAAALLACGSSRTSLSGKIRYEPTAEENYAAGVEEAKDGNDPEAVKLFEYVRTKFPFSKYAALSELRLADLKFDQGRFADAAAAYREFLKLRPTHEEVPYAAFRVGLSHWKDAPSTFRLFPPSHEKDQQAVRDTVAALEGFPTDYPDSPYRPEAERILREARSRLAEHEWYVAGFYAKRGHWQGTVTRLETLLAKYPGSKREEEALFLLAEAYVKVGEPFRAQQALQQLLVKYPGSSRRGEAERLLARLR